MTALHVSPQRLSLTEQAERLERLRATLDLLALEAANAPAAPAARHLAATRRRLGSQARDLRAQLTGSAARSLQDVAAQLQAVQRDIGDPLARFAVDAVLRFVARALTRPTGA